MTWRPDHRAETALSTQTWAKGIEERTKQSLSIATTLSDANLAKCNLQLQSTLYQLPKEIRDLIFLYASTQSTDPAHKYGENSYYYRPGHRARLKSYTSFLLTCKRVWLEANSLPMQQAEHAFWFQRGPYDVETDKRWPVNVRREQHRYENAIRSMTKANLSNLTYIHLFMQMFQAEQFVNYYVLDTFFPEAHLRRGLKPKTFHITIRSSDWMDWEVERPLILNEKWVQALLDEPRLSIVEEFKLELEVWDRKKSQLEPIVERLKSLQGKPKTASHLIPSLRASSKFVLQEPSEAWQWSRSPHLDDQDWPVYQDISTLNLHVVGLKWRHEAHEITEGDNVAKISATAENPLFFPRPVQSVRGFSQARLANYIKTTSVAKAEAVEQLRRDRFGRLMGELEAKRLMEEWRMQGSLLMLKPHDAIEPAKSNQPDLTWLNRFRV